MLFIFIFNVIIMNFYNKEDELIGCEQIMVKLSLIYLVPRKISHQMFGLWILPFVASISCLNFLEDNYLIKSFFL